MLRVVFDLSPGVILWTYLASRKLDLDVKQFCNFWPHIMCNNTQHNDTQHDNKAQTLSIMTLDAEYEAPRHSA
jgi:hypothetical protein